MFSLNLYQHSLQSNLLLHLPPLTQTHQVLALLRVQLKVRLVPRDQVRLLPSFLQTVLPQVPAQVHRHQQTRRPVPLCRLLVSPQSPVSPASAPPSPTFPLLQLHFLLSTPVRALVQDHPKSHRRCPPQQ
jgi:hypothetical protein